MVGLIDRLNAALETPMPAGLPGEAMIIACWAVILALGAVWAVALTRRARNGLSWSGFIAVAARPWRWSFVWSLSAREWALVLLALSGIERWTIAPPAPTWWDFAVRLLLALATARAVWAWWRAPPPVPAKPANSDPRGDGLP